MLIAACGQRSTSNSSPIAPSPQSGTAASSSNVVAIEVDEFTFEEISGGGCGMTLWQVDRTNRDRYLFFNGLDENSMEMKLDDEVVQFRRIAASGSEFYGQQTIQTFVSEDGSTQVTAEVELGEPGEIESVAIKAGTLRINRGEEAIELPVVGDAGC